MAVRVGQANVLPHLQDLQQHLGVLVEQLFVVDVDQRKIVVGEKFLLNEQIPYRALRGIRVLLDESKCVVDVALVDVGDVFPEKLSHPRLVQLLQAVHQVKMGVVGNTLPVKLQVGWVLDFIHQLAQKQIDQLVEGVLASRHIVLAQDSGKLVVFLLLVAGRDGVQVS